MKLTNEEFKAVAVYEQQLQIAVRSRYLRNVGRSGLRVLVPIYERVTGKKQMVHDNCAACIFDFILRIAAIYFADKEERQNAEETAAEEPEQPAEEAAKPRKRGGRKPKNTR